MKIFSPLLNCNLHYTEFFFFIESTTDAIIPDPGTTEAVVLEEVHVDPPSPPTKGGEIASAGASKVGAKYLIPQVTRVLFVPSYLIAFFAPPIYSRVP